MAEKTYGKGSRSKSAAKSFVIEEEAPPVVQEVLELDDFLNPISPDEGDWTEFLRELEEAEAWADDSYSAEAAYQDWADRENEPPFNDPSLYN